MAHRKKEKQAMLHLKNAMWAMSQHELDALMTSIEEQENKQRESFFESLLAWKIWGDEPYKVESSAEGYERIEYEGLTYALIRFEGTIVKRTSSWSQQYGFFGTSDLLPVLDEIENDPGIEGLVLVFDSPGGTVEGTELFAKRLYDFSKKSVAIVDEQCESGAYWIAAQTDKIIATARTSQIGSIGVIMRHTDMSAHNEKYGYKITYITNAASPDKALGNPDTPLSETALEYLVDLVNPAYETFVGQIRKSRRSIDDAALTGKTFLAQEALELGLIDSIGTEDDAFIFLKNKSISNSTMQTKHTPLVKATAETSEEDEEKDLLEEARNQIATLKAQIDSLNEQLEEQAAELEKQKAKKKAAKEEAKEEAKATAAELEKLKAENAALKAKAETAEQILENTPVEKPLVPNASNVQGLLGKMIAEAAQKEGVGTVQNRWNGYAKNPWNRG
jgi:signal peptide peptidase SppA